MKTRVACLAAALSLAMLLPWDLVAQTARGTSLSREAAVRQIESARPQQRVEALAALSRRGRMEDTELMARRLQDQDDGVRDAAESALWILWSRSGDAGIDALFKRGMEQMNPEQAEAAVATFSEIIRLKPDFAEGWNKRATLLFHLGRFQESLSDCDEVMRRNPHHFGALAGYGQIFAHLQEYEKALEYFERALRINPNMHGVKVNRELMRKLIAEKAGRAI
ncbi:MAG: tetratricopeptide repeat protein [Burkholderiales bacterium]|nr:tetratricopeptide repeat protein [Burkholderiales bacterium]